MRHEHQVDWAESLYLDRVDAVDASQQRRRVLLQVFEVGACDLLEEEILLPLRHRLDNEFHVAAEEEEAAGSATRLTRLEDTACVARRLQRLKQRVAFDAIAQAQSLELVDEVAFDLDALVDHELLLGVCFVALALHNRVQTVSVWHVRVV